MHATLIRRRSAFLREAGLVMVFTAILGPAPTASAGDHPVPISGQYEVTITSATQEMNGDIDVVGVAEGNATHLGRLTEKENAVIHPNGTLEASVVLTAANGDQLFCTDVGGFTSPTTTAGTITFMGGTGRFTNASGTANFEAVIAPDGMHYTLTFEGTIQY